MKTRILALLLALMLLTACTPVEPETPAVPEVPATPEAPTTPEVPTIPESPVQTPEEPAAPEQPTMPEVPTLPEPPVEPETPAVPEVPATPEAPVTPEVPAAPETPAVPEIPENPEETIAAFRKTAEDIEAYEEQWSSTYMNQAELNASAAETFRRWDELRGQLLQALPPDTEEPGWEEARETAQKEAAAMWAGGSGAPLAYYKTGCSHTQQHCYDLIRRLEAVYGLSGPVTVERADHTETADHVFVLENRSFPGERGPRFVFRTTETVYDVTVNTLDNAVYEYAGHEELYRIEALRPGETLLTELHFYGVMTTYGLFYTDSSGVRHCWDLCISMNDFGDSLLFSEFAYMGASVDAALQSKEPIRIPERGESRKLSDWISTDGAEFVFLDLDADGAQEAVVRTPENVLVIDEIGGQACGALLSFRSLYDLCIDGFFSWNDTDSNGSWYGQARLEMTPEGCRRTVLWKTLNDGTADARYFLGEQEVSQTDLTQYLNDHPARGEVIFVPLTKAQPLP